MVWIVLWNALPIQSDLYAPANQGSSTEISGTLLPGQTIADLEALLNMIVDNGATLDACAHVPHGLREAVGCTFHDSDELPIDESEEFVEGDDPTKGEFADGDYMENLQLFEGDIRVDPVNHTNHNMSGNRSSQRGTLNDPRTKWVNATVPYVISSDAQSGYTAQNIAFVKQAMCNLQSVSCIRFKPRTTEIDFIKIVSRDGCWSHIGRKGGRQYVSLAKIGCFGAGTPEHEFLHAVGFIHEQSRLDRDTAIVLNLANIIKKPDQTGQFEKYLANEFNQPYDTSSVMQYNSFAFSIDSVNKRTMVRKADGSDIPRPRKLTAPDIMRLNLAYSCASTKRPDDLLFDLTCSSPDRGTDNTPDAPNISKAYPDPLSSASHGTR